MPKWNETTGKHQRNHQDVGKSKDETESRKMHLEEGQFLGYYVTRKGIQPSSVKVDEFMETTPPSTLRDAQGLNGKLNTLSRFISKSTDKAMPLFHTLKGCIEKNQLLVNSGRSSGPLIDQRSLVETTHVGQPYPGRNVTNIPINFSRSHFICAGCTKRRRAEASLLHQSGIIRPWTQLPLPRKVGARTHLRR